MKLNSGWRILVTIAVVGALFYFFNPLEEAASLLDEAPVLVVLAGVGVFANLLLNASVYYYQLRHVKRLAYPRVLSTVMRSWVVESITPGKLGSFAVAWFWQKDGLTLGQGAAISLAYRLSLGVAALALGIAGGMIYFPVFASDWNVFFYAGGAGLLAVLLAGIFWKYYTHLIPAAWRKKLTGFSRTLHQAFFPIDRVVILITMAFFQLGVTSYIFHLMFLFAGYDVGVFPILAATSLVQLAALFPISINGLGIREGLMAVFMEYVGVPIGVTVVIASINTATGYVLAFVFSTVWARELAK